MNRPKAIWFWVVVFLQLCILSTMIAGRVYTRETGSPVLLKTAPIDPWNFLRGDYVRLSYEISQLKYDGTPWSPPDWRNPEVPAEPPDKGTEMPADDWTPPYRRGDVVWVTLEQGEKYWTSVAINKSRPEPRPGQVIAKARVQSAWHEAVQLKYGIEQFFVPQGQGLELEREPTEMDVEAAVDRFGNVAIRRVFFKGKEVRWQ